MELEGADIGASVLARAWPTGGSGEVAEKDSARTADARARRSRQHQIKMIKLAEAAERIAATTRKLEKIAIVAEYLKAHPPEEASVSAVFL